MQTQKQPREGKPAPSGALSLTVSARMVRFSPVRKVARPPLTLPPLPPWQDLFACDRLTRSICSCDPKKARDASPPPQDSQYGKSGSVNQEATQAALAAILARLEVGPVVPQVVVPNNKDYPPLKQTGATPKRKTVATKQTPLLLPLLLLLLLLPLTSPLRTPVSLMLSKGDPLTNSWLNASPNFVKLVLRLLALKRETSVPCTQCTKSGSSPRVFDSFMQAVFPRKAWRPSKGNAGSSLRKSARQDKLVLFCRFAAKTVTTIQRVLMSKPGTFFRSLLASIGGKTLEASHCRGDKIRFKPLNLAYNTGDSPQGVSPSKDGDGKEPAAQQ
ncbi:hypothetical protein BASA84_000730 [Batrachochytrium salamandrivorans]|nr:hypothetical protein BASA84_000730 [Batrachochytrium salamandrivorans]